MSTAIRARSLLRTVEGSINSGMRIVNSLPAFDHCTIRDNQAAYGGGVNIDLSTLAPGSELIIENSTITNNASSRDGGGIWASLTEASLRMQASVVSDNVANPAESNFSLVAGGGIHASGDGELHLITSQIIGNAANDRCGNGGTAKVHGGGIYASGLSVEVDGSVLSANSANAVDGGNAGSETNYSYGGGLHLASGDLIASNSVISDNLVQLPGTHPYPRGGGIYVASGTAHVVDSTIAYNNSEGIRQASGSVTAVNSIVYFNGGEQLVGTFDVTYSNVGGGFRGRGGISP